jgi:hypothetical protein
MNWHYSLCWWCFAILYDLRTSGVQWMFPQGPRNLEKGMREKLNARYVGFGVVCYETICSFAVLYGLSLYCISAWNIRRDIKIQVHYSPQHLDAATAAPFTELFTTALVMTAFPIPQIIELLQVSNSWETASDATICSCLWCSRCV